MPNLNKVQRAIKNKEELYQKKQWYTIRSLLGNQWANWFVLIGARERGKSYSVQEYCLRQFFDKKSKLYHVPFYWWRLNDIAVKTMLMNNGAKLFEALLVYSFHLENIKVKGDTIFVNNNEKPEEMIPLCYVWGLSTAYNNKGSSIFDSKKFKGCNIMIDEIALEKGQRRTFDLAYNLKMQIENTTRSKRENVRIFMILNNTQECPAVLSMFNFIPLKWGVYKLKKKHCVIDFIPNTEAYEERRKKALANELDNGTGNFTNTVERDLQLLYKGRIQKPTAIIKFDKQKSEWFTLWDNNVIRPYNGEKTTTIAMLRYLDDNYNPETIKNIIELTDARCFYFKDLFTQTHFYECMKLIKK